MSDVRLQKYIAECGVASRRGAEKLILDGKVRINGKVIRKLGTKIDPSNDEVSVDKKRLGKKEEKIYLKLNKPRGYVTSCFHPGQRTIMELVSDIPYRLYPVGRLDKDSEGLLILTNDGELANQLMHPRYEHEKEYEVCVQGPMSDLTMDKLCRGVVIEGKKTLPAQIKKTSSRKFRIILKEGRKRQIRKMVAAVGNGVVQLKRIRMKNIKLGKLPPGQYAPLSPSEISGLML